MGGGRVDLLVAASGPGASLIMLCVPVCTGDPAGGEAPGPHAIRLTHGREGWAVLAGPSFPWPFPQCLEHRSAQSCSQPSLV